MNIFGKNNPYEFNLDKKSVTFYFMVLMVVTWIITNSVTETIPFFAFIPSQFLTGKITSIILYPFVENGLFSVVIQCLILFMIGNQFEKSLGTKKYLKLFVVSSVSGALFGLALFMLGSFPVTLTSMYGFILTLFLLRASESPDSEVMFFFVFKMKMRTMIYISLGILFLLATVKSQHSLWATMASVLCGFSYIKSFKQLSFLLPQNVNFFKRKNKTSYRRNNGEFVKTDNQVNNVIKIRPSKYKPEE